VLQLAALILLAAMLYRYANTEVRRRTLINIIIGVAVVSALYGILRQSTQHSVGFGLPLLKPDQGYGQFINRNHFAFLMEMGFGLALGIILGGGVKRDQGLIYLGALLPIWSGLVLSNSRGGILAMLAQMVSAALLFTFVGKPTFTRHESTAARLVRSVPARAAMLLVLVVSVAVGTLWLGGDRLATKLEQANQEFDPVAAELRQNARRNQIWRATWRMFTAHPIAGVGLGGYWMAIPAFHDASGMLTPQEAHNDYLELLASGGLIGLAVGIWFVVLLYRRIRENLRATNRFRSAACFGAALGLWGVAVHSLVDFGLHTFANALVFTSLIVIATAISAGKTPQLDD
jgi:O-antigen ligase